MKMVIKTIDGVVLSGEMVNNNKDILTLKQLKYHSITKPQVPNLKENPPEQYVYNGDVNFHWDKVIWHCIQ